MSRGLGSSKDAKGSGKKRDRRAEVETYGLFGFLLKVYEYNYAGGEEGCGGEGEFRCGRHGIFI